MIDLEKLLNERVTEYNYLCQDAGNINDCYDRPFIIFGASTAGKEFLKYVCKFKKVFPIAFCDNDPRKQDAFVEGIPVLSIHKMMEAFSGNYTFIFTGYYL